MSDQLDKSETHLVLTVDIVAAYVSNNPVPANDLPALIEQVHKTLSGIMTGTEVLETEVQKPAVNPKRSVHNDHIVCLEDGKKFKSLKRHIAAHHGLSPHEYRTKWGLPADYPMVAPGYAAKRSDLAKKLGLGRKPKATPEPIKRVRRPKAA